MPGTPTASRISPAADPTTGLSAPPSRRFPIAAAQLLGLARRGLQEAAASPRPAERYAGAHLSALRCAAAVLAAKAKPEPLSGRRGRRPRNAWSLLADVAPEMAEWAAFFAAGAAKRAAAEAGIEGSVTVREADDLVRDVETFLALIETSIEFDLARSHQQSFRVAS